MSEEQTKNSGDNKTKQVTPPNENKQTSTAQADPNAGKGTTPETTTEPPKKKVNPLDAILDKKKAAVKGAETLTILGQQVDVPKRKYATVYMNDEIEEWSPLEKHLQGDVNKELGSFFRNRSVFRPLEYELENIIMPDIVGLKPQEQGYSKAVLEYWKDWSFTPLAKELGGTKLDITTVKVKIMSSTGNEIEIDYPLNVDDYVKYIMAKENKTVCYGEENMKFKNNFIFVLIENAKQEKEENIIKELKVKANIAYASLVSTIDDSRDTCLAAIELLKDPGDFLPSNLSNFDISSMLMEYAQADPYLDDDGVWKSEFLNVINDKNLETRALLSRLIHYGVLIQNGNDIYNGDENIGSTYDQAITKLNDPVYSGKVQKLKSILAQKRKEEIARRIV